MNEAILTQCCNQARVLRCAGCPYRKEADLAAQHVTLAERHAATGPRWVDDAPPVALKSTVAPLDRSQEKIAPTSDDLINPKTLIGARRVDLSLLPPAGVIHGAHAMMDGAEKYGPYNWREKKVPARTYIAAAQRHLADFLDGEALATDSGVHHLGHVIGCCAIVLDAMETGNLIDDRPKPGAAAAILARLEIAILERRASRGARAAPAT